MVAKIKSSSIKVALKLTESILILFLLISCQINEKKQALNFINANMVNKASSEKKIIGNNGNTIPFSPYHFESLYLAKDSLSGLLRNNATFNSVYKDSETVLQPFLEKHVDLMLKHRSKSVFLKQLDFNEFCEFVLPYRAGNELFVDYHQELVKRFSACIEALPEIAGVTEKAVVINSKLKNLLKFDLRSHAQLYEPGIIEILNEGKGSCNSLTAVTAQTMRFFGIPTAIDECPVWGHRNSGHRWNAFLTEQGEWIPFGGAETNPNEFDVISDSVKAPKIYRHTFSAQKGFHPPVKDIDKPVIFGDANRIDVTEAYGSTADITVELNASEYGEDILYLAVFNAEKWRIVSWTKIKNGSATFEKLGNNNIVYLPCFYKNRKVIPVTFPIILREDREEIIKPNFEKCAKVELDTYNKFFDFKWNIGTPKQGHKMELLYWDNGWKSCGISVVGVDNKLKFADVPKNALYWLKSYDWENTWQRIFTIEDGEQVWY